MPENPTREALPPGETPLPEVRGFALHALLGRGCVGTTYRASHVASGRQVALKLVHPQLSSLPTTPARLETLGAASRRMAHACLPHDREIGSLPGTRVVFAHAEYIDGVPLTAALQRETTTLREIVESFCALLSALAEAHRHGVLHLGLRPGNVLLAEAPGTAARVVLCDLGLNRLLKYDGKNNALTQLRPEHLAYLCPEQLRGEALDGRADIFGVGALLFEALTGAPAFEAATAADTIAAICEGERIAPSRRHPGRSIPRELEAVCLRALERPAEQRFRSALEMSQALRATLDVLGKRADVPLGSSFVDGPTAPPTMLRATLPGDHLPSRISLGLGALLLVAAVLLYECSRPAARAPRPEVRPAATAQDARR